MNTVLVGGSRDLSPAGLAAVRFVAAALSVSDARFTLGDARGADAAFYSALAALVGVGRLRVFCVGGAPAWALPAVCVPFAGGPAHVPYRARLVHRSAAAAAGADFGVFVVSKPFSPGSLRTAALIAKMGGAVRFFSAPFAGEPAALPGLAGGWVSVGAVPGARAWAWVNNHSDLLLGGE